MCQIMEEMCDEAENRGIAKGIAKGRAEGIAKGKMEGRAEGKVESIVNLMESMNIPMERAMDILKVPANDRQMYADLVAISRN